MKNPFKFSFLLVSLISSAAAVFNSSLPLSGTDLILGHNSSKLVERKVELFLSGGAGVKIFTFYGKSESSQRGCTLSFPVRDTVTGYKGYLTSWNCGNGDVFVREFQVGECIVPSNFDPKRGLDYIFVRIFDEYWSEERGSFLAFSEVFNNNQFEALPMTIPTQIPFLGITVCAYGGKSGFVCGAVVDLNAVIDVYVPWDRSGEGKYTSDKLSGVVKVLTEKDYAREDMGAPVYIAGQIPFQPQLFASPVGMVVENVGENSEKKIWYFTPIDRILQDSGLQDKKLELLLGNFGESEEKTT